jgi:signal peptidase I
METQTPSVSTAPTPLPGSSNPTPHKAPAFWRELLSTLTIILAAFVIALLLIGYVFQSYAVDGRSMQNTLHNNDRLIVWKVPRTWARITGHQYVPKRGDIIIFNQSGLADYGQPNERQLIKRVIGEPGDHVVVKNGKITVYNSAHPSGFNPDTTLPYGAHGMPYTNGDINVTLSANQLFVCGDNRPDSLDSRTFGPINTDQVVGKLLLRILPFSQAERF